MAQHQTDRSDRSEPLQSQLTEHDRDDDLWQEADEEEVPTVVLYVIAGMLLLSFTLYLIVGGGHNHFH